MRHEALDSTFYFKFTTRDFDTGAPQTLGGTPAIAAYEDANLTQITAGITLTANYDAKTGLNHVAVVATTANGYEEGKYYAFAIETGTVDGVSVVGEVVHECIIGPQISNVTEWGGVSAAVKVGATTNLPQTDPHALNNSLQSAADLQDFADNGYDPVGNVSFADVTTWQGFLIPGASMIENDGGGAGRYTIKALEQAPSGGGGGGNIDISPASFMNDQRKNEVTEINWTTKDNTGVPVAPTVNGSVYALEDGVSTKITAGITTTYNIGAENGYHLTEIDTSNAAYSPEATYSVYSEGMTVDGVANTGTALAGFTIRTQSIDDIYGNGLISAAYDWDTNTAATDPGPGNIKVNNATYSLVTEIYVNGASKRELNISGLVEALKVGDLIVIAKNKDTTKFLTGRVTAEATDNTGWYTIPVSITESGDSIENNAQVDFGMFFIRQPLSPEETAQLRDGVGIDGDKIAAVGGQLQVVAADVDGLEGAAMRGTDNALLAASAPTNFEDMAITDTTGQVTVGTNNDKTGYSLAADITVKRGVAFANFPVYMTDTASPPNPAPGLTVSGQIKQDAGTFATLTNPVVDAGLGWYRVSLTAAEMSADAISLNFTAPGAATRAIAVLTQDE